MSFLSEIVDGLARLLDERAVGVYRPDGIYAAGETAITDTVMPDGPDRAIVLTAYPVTESAALTDTVLAVQVRTRAGPDPREVGALDDDVFAVLHASGRHTFGTARITLIYRFSSGSLGADANGRQERTSNYRLRANRPHPGLE
ncbi:minor capsid protein [Streptomyces sp. NBC_01381]|uniref:minor capsid protein n=1 Tax=Streptomyces sp. NBC_01381 TaxID=2903845 RepID=UPI00224D2DCB|nr:minor capsid protein [Streptomyces sp. NBC_01381]MCX4672405.1 minor capsid protein [Streptomyces sp. NBC_01381]